MAKPTQAIFLNRRCPNRRCPVGTTKVLAERIRDALCPRCRTRLVVPGCGCGS